MKAIAKRTFTILTGLLVFAPLFAQAAHEPSEQRQVKVVLAGGGDEEVETHEFDLEDMYPGETREFVSSSGKVIEVTRTEDGQRITIDGEELDLSDHGLHHENSEGQEHECGRQVRIRKEILIDSEDGEEGEARRVVKIMKLGDDDEDIDIEVLGSNIEEIIAQQCEEGDEDCDESQVRIRVLELLGEEALEVSGDENVVIIKKRIRHEHEHEDEN